MLLSERAAHTEQGRTRTRTWTMTRTWAEGTQKQVHLRDIMASSQSLLHPNCQETKETSLHQNKSVQNHPVVQKTAVSNCLCVS
eukprot:superscaffoldBa00007794_g22835